MATTKYQVTKIVGVPGVGVNPITADHVYFSVEQDTGPAGFPSWNDQMYTQYVTDQLGQARRVGILATEADTEGAIHFGELDPGEVNAKQIQGALVAKVGSTNGAQPYGGQEGFGRVIALGNTFKASYDAGLGTYILDVDAGQLGGGTMDDFTIGLIGNAQNVFGLYENNSSTGVNSVIVNDGDKIDLKFDNQSQKHSLLANRNPTTVGEPSFRKIVSGVALKNATDPQQSDVWGEAIPNEGNYLGSDTLSFLTHIGITEDWMQQVVANKQQFQRDEISFASPLEQFSLVDVQRSQTFLPTRTNNTGAGTSGIALPRNIEVGTAKDVIGTGNNAPYAGDLNFEAATIAVTDSIGRIPIIFEANAAGFSKQTHLDATYFVNKVDATTGEDILSLDATALGQQYVPAAGLNLNTNNNEFGFSNEPTPTGNNNQYVNLGVGKYDGIDIRDRHIKVAYNASQFVINANGELELKPGVIGDSDWKESARVATSGNVGTGYSDTGGTGGTGQLTGMPQTIDGVTLAVGDRVLVKGQTNNIDPNNNYSKENGIYEVITVGTGASGVWDRADDHNTDQQVSSGNTVHIDEGNVHKDEIWRLVTDDPINVENGLATQTGQHWERIATFAITDGPGVWIQPTQGNKVGFVNAFTVGGTQIEAKAGDEIRGILYEQDYIGVAIDTDLLTYRLDASHNPGSNVYRQKVSLADMPSRSVLVQNTGMTKPEPLASPDHGTVNSPQWGEVLVSNGTNYAAGNSDLEWSKISDKNIAIGAGISVSKFQEIDPYSFWVNNTNVDAPADEIMTFAPQSVVIRQTSSDDIINLVIGGGATGEQGGFMARPRTDANPVGNLQACVFDPDNFGWTGNKVYVGWADVQW